MSDHVSLRPGVRSRIGWGAVLLSFLAMAGALLFTEHRAHVLGAGPWLFLLSCPLLHWLLHSGHRRGGGRGRPPRDRPAQEGRGARVGDPGGPA